jgi:hypothetical protein
MSDQPSPPPASDAPEKKPFGPGMLLLLGFGLLALAGWCFKDVVYPADAAEEWRKEGETFNIYLNWAVMVGGALGAAYAFVLAAQRWKTGGDGGQAPPATGGPASPEVPERPAVSLGPDAGSAPAPEAPKTEESETDSDEEETPGDENAPPT